MGSTQTAPVVVVNDGQYRWGADRSQLLAALAAQGWHEAGSGLWEEPEAGEDEDSTAAYAELCNAVDSVAGEGSTEPMTDELLESAGRFTFRPDYGQRTWLLS